MSATSSGAALGAFGTLGRRAGRRRARLSATLYRYLGRQVLIGVGTAVFGLAMVALVADLVELLRRAQGRPDATFGVVVLMAGLHLPYLLQKLMPFAILFGTMLTYQRLSRSHELVAVRAIGVSVWQFLSPALTIALALGVFMVVAFNPFAAVLFARFETLEQSHLSSEASLITVARGGLWLRQRHEQEELLIHARHVDPELTVLEDVVIFFYDADRRFTGRVDAPRAHLQPGRWELKDPLRTWPDGTSERAPSLQIPTDLTRDRLEENFAAPETVSFWDLPGFIEDLELIGFSARAHRLHWHGLLATPLLLCAMLLIGTTSALRLVRRGGVGRLIAAGLFTGFAFYIFTDVISAIGLSGRLPLVVAAWAPAGIGVLLGVTTLLHLEDG